MKFIKVLTLALILTAVPVFAGFDEVTIDNGMQLYEPYLWLLGEMTGDLEDTVSVTVTNTSLDPWGNFHFEIYDGGEEATSVVFLDSSNGGIAVDPTGTMGLDAWLIASTEEDYSCIDLRFYDNPLAMGESATFTVYIINTEESLPSFGMVITPAAVPEPATIALVSLGGLVLLRRKK